MVKINTIGLFFVGMALSLSGYSQNYFYKTYTGGAFDVGQGVCEVPGPEYAITGSTSAISGGSDAFLMLIDSVGNQLWTKGYGGAGSDWGRRVFHRESEGYWIIGYSNSYGEGDFEFSVWKIDDSGVLEWEKSFGTTGWDRLWDATELANGDFILVGETEGEDSAEKDVLMMRIDDEGNQIWQNQIDNEGDDVAYASTLYDDTTVIVVGEYFENNENVGLLIKLDIDGTINDQWTYNDEGPATFKDVDVNDEEVFVCGSANITSPDYLNTIILRLDKSNTIIDAEIGDTEGGGFATNILAVSANKVYWTLSTTSSFFNVFPDGSDVLIFRYNNELFYFGPIYNTSGVGDDEYHQLILTSDGGYIGVGLCSDDRVFESSGNDIMVVKVGPNDQLAPEADEDEDFLVVEEHLSNESELYLFPNPTSNYLYLPEEFLHSDIQVYNSIGQKEYFEVHGNKLYLSHLMSGVYSVSISTNSTHSTFRVVKK